MYRIKRKGNDGGKLGRVGQGDSAIESRSGFCLKKCKLRFIHNLRRFKTEERNCSMQLIDEFNSQGVNAGFHL